MISRFFQSCGNISILCLNSNIDTSVGNFYNKVVSPTGNNPKGNSGIVSAVCPFNFSYEWNRLTPNEQCSLRNKLTGNTVFPKPLNKRSKEVVQKTNTVKSVKKEVKSPVKAPSKETVAKWNNRFDDVLKSKDFAKVIDFLKTDSSTNKILNTEHINKLLRLNIVHASDESIKGFIHLICQSSHISFQKITYSNQFQLLKSVLQFVDSSDQIKVIDQLINAGFSLKDTWHFPLKARMRLINLVMIQDNSNPVLLTNLINQGFYIKDLLNVLNYKSNYEFNKQILRDMDYALEGFLENQLPEERDIKSTRQFKNNWINTLKKAIIESKIEADIRIDDSFYPEILSEKSQENAEYREFVLALIMLRMNYQAFQNPNPVVEFLGRFILLLFMMRFFAQFI